MIKLKNILCEDINQLELDFDSMNHTIKSKTKIPIKASKKYLYHATNIKNLDTIKKFGLIPDIGETIRGSYGDSYDFDNTGDDERVSVDIDGILFFSDEPGLFFSQFGSNDFDWNKAIVCIIVKNNTIYHKVDDYPKFTDCDGHEVETIGYYSAWELPIFIETGDWFSFEEQKCKYVLHGEKLKNFIKVNFPHEYNKYKEK